MSAMLRLSALLIVSAALVLAAPSGAGTGVRHVLLGRSVEGRAIVAVEVGDPHAKRKVLVVGCIHGNETAGIAIARHLERTALPVGLDLWIVESLNPDGQAAGTRDNARGVDLNRNFPWGWRPLEGVFDSGPRALSEPESRIVYRLILRLKPGVSIWFHQSLNVVDLSGGWSAVERRFAALAGLRVRVLPRYPGSVTTWENHALPGTTAFVVELPAGQPTAARTARYARAALAVSG